MDTASYSSGAVAAALAISLLAGLSTGLGGLAVVLKRSPGPKFLAAALGFSAGVMVYISFVELYAQGADSLAEASVPNAELWAAVAFFAGIALIALIDHFVPEEINPHEKPHHLEGGSVSGGTRVSRSRMRNVGVLTALAIAIHNFPEGFATFAVALADPSLGIPLAVAIAIHNIPEGVAVAVPLREATGSRRKAAGWATLSGLAEPLGGSDRLRPAAAVPRARDSGLHLRRHRRDHGLCQPGQAPANRRRHGRAPQRHVRDGRRDGGDGREPDAAVAERRGGDARVVSQNTLRIWSPAAHCSMIKRLSCSAPIV